MENGSSLDDVILQVFEENVDKFTFPITTHKQARDFCRLLNRKGLKYEVVAEEVGEKLNYFENWRLISGEENPIGDKVIKVLNRPLQDTMLIDDDAEDDDEMDKVKQLLFSGKSIDVDEDAEATLKALDEKRHAQALKSLREAQENAAKEKAANEHAESHSTKKTEKKESLNEETQKTDTKFSKTSENKLTEISTDSKSISNISDNSKKDSSAANASESKTINSESVKQDVNASEPEKSSYKVLVVQKKNTVKEPVQSSCKPPDKTTNNTQAETTHVAQKTITSPPTSPASPHSPVHAKLEDSTKSSTPSAEPVTKASAPTPKPDKIDGATDNTKEKPSKPEPTSPAVADDKKVSKSDEKSVQIAGSNQTDSNCSLSPKATNDKVSLTVSPTSSPAGDVSHKKAPNTPAAVTPSTPKSTTTTPSSGYTTPVIDLSIMPKEINENYDSDLDHEDVDLKSNKVKVIESVCRFKKSVEDGTGYVYLFSDTTGSKPVEDLTGIHRVKVGASRFPEKRLKQATIFNPDLRLVTSKHVTNRRAALSKIQEELSGMLYRGTPLWYRGAIDKILEALEALI